MTYRVFLSETASRQLKRLGRSQRERIVEKLKALREDPLGPRPGMDVKSLAGTSPRKHRLRVGVYRAVYLVEGDEVKVIEIFRRGRDYR